MSLDDNLRALERTPLLADVGRDVLRLLAFSAETVDLEDGDVLFAQGVPADRAFTILRGRIKLDAGGHNVRTVGTGALIGEMALLIETQRPCEAVAVEPTRLIAIPRAVFLRLLEEFPAVAEAMRAKLLARLRSEQATLNRIQARLDGLPGRED